LEPAVSGHDSAGIGKSEKMSLTEAKVKWVKSLAALAKFNYQRNLISEMFFCGIISLLAGFAATVVDRIRSDLPPGVRETVFSFLPARQIYLVMVRKQKFKLLILNIKNLAQLESEDAAIDFFWKFNENEISSEIFKAQGFAADSGLKSVALNFLRKNRLWLTE